MDKNKQQKIKDGILAGFMIGIPVLIAITVGIVYWIKTGLFPEPGLKWNDEAAYLQMIKNCITTGNPVGYWGFNGNHAIVGTGGAWNPAIIWPYAIFAFLFPITPGFVFFVNLFYITLANVLFYLAVKPEGKYSLRLILTQATSAILILYLSVNMSEIFRYAIAIVIAGLLYRMFFKECAGWIKYVATPLLILAAVQVYVFFAFCVPVYVFALMKGSKLWKKLLAGVGGMGVVALGSYYLLHLISSNYNIHKTETLLNAVKAMDVTGALVAFLGMVKQGMREVYLLWTYIYANPLIPWHIFFCIALVAVAGILVFFYFKNKKKDTEEAGADKKHDAILGGIVLYSIPLFYFMYMTLYSIEPFTFVRGTQIAVVFSLWLLCMMKNKILYYVVIALQAISLFFLPANMDTFMENRYQTQEQKEEWAVLEEEFAEVFVLDENLGPWANTVCMFTMEPKPICALPGGFGVNFIMDDGVFPEEAGYLLFSKENPEDLNREWVEKSFAVIYESYGELLDRNYSVIYESEDYVVYRKNN